MSPITETTKASRDQKLDCCCGQPVEPSAATAHCSRCGRNLRLVLAA